MHKRIKELAKAAGLKQTKWADVETDREPVRIWQESLNDPGALERFAQLIVRECSEIYEKMDNGNLHMGTDNYLVALAKHFGVEE